ncbi:nitroreductase family protein [Actinophytocola xanthii]|uniref:Nitroreductase n=1 Tax=Actinophytocola xanthii TaxID=1912961 RepID=A0A1Q8CNI4_9PSEU|nr:nitroreductase family protein [Actinophytocola xanthii]OLF15896.1 nitroreductase [Actinophytocola xanthii]
MDKDAETSVPVHELIRTRWSPRALDPNGQVSEVALRAMLEAARWAPSNGNTQPARFMVGRRGDETYERILALLSQRNREWAWPSAVLVLACVATRNEKGQVPMAEYGVGLAVQNLVLQAVAEGVAAHQMGGFDREGAKLSFALPEDIQPLVVIALGTLGSPDQLDDARRDRELAPRRRRPLAELAFTGEWGNPAF